MYKLDLFWTNYSHYDEEKDDEVLNDDAPEEAQESYNHYLQQVKDHAEAI